MVRLALFTLGIWLVVTSCAATPDGKQTGVSNDLKLVCANSDQLHLTRSSQIRALAQELRLAGPNIECPKQTVSALEDLGELVEQNRNSICSLEATDRIRGYHDTYVSSLFAARGENGEQKATDGELAPALRNFFLGYGLQVSSLCKKNMISTLMYESEHTLTKQDHELIGPWINEESLISQLISDPNDYDDILLPRDISQVLAETRSGQQHSVGDGSSSADGKIFMQVQTGPVIKRMKAICRRRFKPIYEQLILPLLYLSNMGFNYKGEELERELKEMSLNKEIHQWYRIVYLCESLEGLELVEDPADAVRMEGTDRRLVRILTPEEAAAIREQNHAGAADEDELLKDLPQIVYEMPSGILLEDEILNESDANLMRLINSFATHKTELDRIKSKLIHKLTRFLINKLKHGQIHVAFGAIIDGLRGRDDEDATSPDGANRQVIEALDSYVDAIYNPDKPVACRSVKKLGKRYYHQFASLGAQDYKNIGKEAKDKVTIKRGFWYFLAITLFVSGLILALSG